MTVEVDPCVEAGAKALYELNPHHRCDENYLELTGEMISWDETIKDPDPYIQEMVAGLRRQAEFCIRAADAVCPGLWHSENVQQSWKDAIGDAYTPSALGKHRAAHPLTIRRVLDSVCGTEAADVIVAMVFWNSLHSEQVEELSKMLSEAQLALEGNAACTCASLPEPPDDSCPVHGLTAEGTIRADEREAIIDLIAERCGQHTTPSQLIELIRTRGA